MRLLDFIPSFTARPIEPVTRAVSRRRRRGAGEAGGGSEDGYILIAVLFLVFLVLISLTIAAPKVTADLERDREIELMHRGLQFRRAIQLYYKKFAAYPPNLDALEKSNNLRFLRKRYKDPATGKDEWKLIHVGENKAPTAMGFFGQAMGGVSGSTIAGTGPGGMGQMGQGLGAGLGGNNAGGGIFGSNPGPVGATIGSPPTDAGSPAAGTTGVGTGSSDGTGTGTGQTAAQTFGAGNGTGQTFGGGGIIGVESTSPKATILVYKKMKHFNEWEFVYDPQSERQTVSSSGSVGQPAGSVGNGGAQQSPSQTNGFQPGTNQPGPSLPTGNPTTPN